MITILRDTDDIRTDFHEFSSHESGLEEDENCFSDENDEVNEHRAERVRDPSKN